MNFQIPNNDFSETSAFKSGLLFVRDIFLFRTCFFFQCVRLNLYTRMCVATIKPVSLLSKIVKTPGKTLVEACFFFVFSSLDFSVYFNYLSRITFWVVGDHFQVSKVLEGTGSFRGGGPLPGPQGV